MKLGISLRGADARTRLATYLNDHLAAATAELELARRARASNECNRYGELLQGVVADVEAEREALRGVMRRLDVREDPLKAAFAWGGEKAGRLKLNGQLLGYSPLSRLIELEGLSLAAAGMLWLWLALGETHSDDPRLEGVDLSALATRARDRRQRVDRMRRRAAAEALT